MAPTSLLLSDMPVGLVTHVHISVAIIRRDRNASFKPWDYHAGMVAR
jgi:hypothetical protein